MLWPWRRDQFRVRGKEILEADKGRFPVRQCDLSRQYVIAISGAAQTIPEADGNGKGGSLSTPFGHCFTLIAPLASHKQVRRDLTNTFALIKLLPHPPRSDDAPATFSDSSESGQA